MKRNKGKISILLGLLLIAAALVLTSYNLYDELRAERAADEAVTLLEKQMPAREQAAPAEPSALPAQVPSGPEEIELPDYVLNPEMEMPVAEINGIDYIGTLRIPALELNLPIISQWSYANLRFAPCRYAGSAYLDNLVVAGHNYQAHFAALKNLAQGDAVSFTDMDGNTFYYEVAALETLAPTDIEGMVSGVYDLTLFTCTVGGASRVAVRCDLVEEDIP